MEGIITTPISPGVSPVQLGDCIDELLKFVLQSSVDGNLGVDIALSKDYCSHLLKDDTSDPERFPASEISGVPSYPLYKHLASVLYQCIADGFIQTTSLAVPPICEDSCLKLAEEKWNKLIMEEGFQIRHMLKHVSFELNVQEPYFLQLKDGLKTIEGRCAVGYYNRGWAMRAIKVFWVLSTLQEPLQMHFHPQDQLYSYHLLHNINQMYDNDM